MASSIREVLESCPYPLGKYDLKIGTSERGDRSVEDTKFNLPPSYQHSLIVFGGIAGIEECVDADESIKVSGSQSRTLFDVWLNICPYQGSRTIRTEEAVMIGLAKLSPFLTKSALDKPFEVAKEEEEGEQVAMERQDDVEFSDETPSEESSEEDEA
jgi:methyltransferase